MMKSSYEQHFLGFYSGWAKYIVSNNKNNDNNNKGLQTKYLGKNLFTKSKSIITS